MGRNRVGIHAEGIEGLSNYFQSLGKLVHAAEDATLIRAGQRAAELTKENAPRSAIPRGPNKKNNKQDWRTGRHAADRIRSTKPKWDELGQKYVEVGVPMDRRGRTPYFYLRILEVGGMGGRIPALRFFARAREQVGRELPQIAADELNSRIKK